MSSADIRFYFDPVCPFCWLTSKWIRMVQAERDFTVDWRFISLRLINSHIDYDAHFPPEYEAGHTAGLRLLRVAARVRAEHGPQALDPLQAVFGAHIFDTPPPTEVADEKDQRERRGTREFVEPILREAGLPTDLADALDEESWDREIRADGEDALMLTGKDVGTPIIHFEPPDGVAFFGPVISRLPEKETAGELWDHVVGLARFPGFAELKRSLREEPQLVGFGVPTGTTGEQEDWHGGSRHRRPSVARSRRTTPLSNTDAPAILLVNPNTNESTTRMMAKLARVHLGPAGVKVEVLTVDAGPAMIVDHAALAASSDHVVRAVRRSLSGPAGDRIVAVIIGAIGDPGREELAGSCGVPVVGIGQASILAAAADGRRFGMATSTPLLADSLAGLVGRHGMSGQFTGVRFTRSEPLTLAADPQRQYEELTEAVRTCVDDDGAEAVIIAGGPLSETARRLTALDLVAIIEPVPSASRLVLATLARAGASSRDAPTT